MYHVMVAAMLALTFWAFALALCDDRLKVGRASALGASWAAMSSPLDGDGPPPSGPRLALSPAQIEARAKLGTPKFQGRIERWLYKLMIPARDRDDVRAEVTEAALRSIHTYDPTRARFERYVNAIAVHVASHYRDKARHRREELVAEPPAQEDHDARPDAALDAEELRRAVRAALLEVPSEERAVLVAHDIEGEEMQSIAARLGMPLSTAYKWRARGVLALRVALVKAR